MNVYNPLDATQAMEAAGLERRQAEAIARVIGDSKNDLVTNDILTLKLDTLESRLDTKLDALESRLNTRTDALESRFETKMDALELRFETKMDAALNRQLVRIGVLFAAILTLACTVISLLNSVK